VPFACRALRRYWLIQPMLEAGRVTDALDDYERSVTLVHPPNPRYEVHCDEDFHVPLLIISPSRRQPPTVLAKSGDMHADESDSLPCCPDPRRRCEKLSANLAKVRAMHPQLERLRERLDQMKARPRQATR
jgi:hypothetical protein